MEKDWRPLPFSGASMNPTFYDVHSVWVDFSKNEVPRPGDIVFYRDMSAEWVCHRLIFEDKDCWGVMGDSSTGLEWIPKATVWGIARAVQRSTNKQLRVSSPLGRPICFLQRKQASARHIFARKFYRFFARLVLYLNKWLSMRSFNHKTS